MTPPTTVRKIKLYQFKSNKKYHPHESANLCTDATTKNLILSYMVYNTSIMYQDFYFLLLKWSRILPSIYVKKFSDILTRNAGVAWQNAIHSVISIYQTAQNKLNKSQGHIKKYGEASKPIKNTAESRKQKVSESA